MLDDMGYCCEINKLFRKNRKMLLFVTLFCEVEKKFEIGWKVGLKLLPLCAIRYRPNSSIETLKQTK